MISSYFFNAKEGVDVINVSFLYYKIFLIEEWKGDAYT
jgi:hypothetical protein